MSLTDAMRAAQDAAKNLPVTQDNSPQALAPVALGTSLDDFLAGGARPDRWLKVNEVGIWLARDEKLPLAEGSFEGELDIENIQLFHGLRAEFAGNVVKYAKSYDGGKTTTQGENFAAVAADFAANAMKFTGNYRGADTIIVLTEDIVQGKTTIPAGTKIGYSTPVTGFAPFQALMKELSNDGRIHDAGGGRLTGERVRVRLVHSSETNNNKQEYGVISFEVVE